MFGIVFEQTVILFILILIGVILAKCKIFDDNAIKSITNLVLYLIAPATIVKSFIREKNEETISLLLTAFIASFIILGCYILISSLLFKKTEQEKKAVLRFGIVFSNCGFMSLPLLQAIVGDNGVLVGTAFIAAFNIFAWTYGVYIMDDGNTGMSLRKILINPGMIAIVCGFIIFGFSIPIHNVISAPIVYLSSLNTPVPMLIIGYNIYKTDLLKVFKDKQCFLAALIRLVIYPLVTVFLLHIVGIQGELLVSLAICSCAPTAAKITMFAVKFEKSVDMSVNLVALTTLVSLITMPIIITLAMNL